MKRSVEILGGGVLGLCLGTVFLATPVASVLTSYVKATWSLAGCPAGNYVLASTAQIIGGGQTFTVSTPVRIPRTAVVQTFNDVPSGTYAITAVLRRTGGNVVVGTATQTASTADGVAALARSRAPEQPAVGKARPRWPQLPVSPAAAVPPKTSIAPPAPPPAALPRAVPRPVAASPREWVLADLIRLSDPDGEPGWTRVELVDLDGDALADEIRIESPNGSTTVWRLVRQPLTTR
jgi:hypothetical protein